VEVALTRLLERNKLVLSLAFPQDLRRSVEDDG
jgi:hypothetical protein